MEIMNAEEHKNKHSTFAIAFLDAVNANIYEPDEYEFILDTHDIPLHTVPFYKETHEGAVKYIQSLEKEIAEYRNNPTVELERSIERSLDMVQYKIKNLKRMYLQYAYMISEPKELAEVWLDEETYSIVGMGVDSTNKAPIMMKLYEGGYDFIKLIQANWVSCDDFGELTSDLINAFEESGMKAIHHMDDRNADWFHALSDDIKIYRGCGLGEGEYGLSWTTEERVAKKFALNHRFYRYKEPVILCGYIKKEDVYYATNARNEFEIICNAENITNLEVKTLKR